MSLWAEIQGIVQSISRDVAALAKRISGVEMRTVPLDFELSTTVEIDSVTGTRITRRFGLDGEIRMSDELSRDEGSEDLNRRVVTIHSAVTGEAVKRFTYERTYDDEGNLINEDHVLTEDLP